MEGAALEHRAPLCVPANHPALPGHFPGNPVVPGVVLLDAVLQLAEDWRGAPLHVAEIRQVKFPGSLRAAETAEVSLRLHAALLEFTVTRAAQVLARGQLVLAERRPA